MAIRLVRAHREHGVEHQHATVCPGRQEAAVVGRGFVVWEVVFQGDVDVCEGWGSAGRRAHAEAEAVGLVDVVVRVLAED